VQAGNILAGLGWRFYNDGSLYPLIMMVNDGIIFDPDKIEPNMRLTIPSLKENMNDAKARESLNRKLMEIAVIEERRGRSRTAALMRNHVR
jgi:hypothetical protein